MITIRHNVERSYTLLIYKFIIAMLIIDPLLSKFISITTVLRSIEILCLMCVFYYEFNLFARYGNKYLNKAVCPLICIFLIVSLVIIYRGNWALSVKDIGLHILSPTLIYILPFLILPLPNYKYRFEILHVFYYSSLFVIPIWILNINNLVQIGPTGYLAENIGEYLPFFSAFLLGFLKYFDIRKKYITLIIWAFFLLLMLLNARRNVTFSLLLYSFIAYIFLKQNEMKKNPIKFLLILLVFILGLMIIIYNFDNLSSGIFKNMANRVSEDTRSGVEQFFFLDFMNSPIEDWIFGRGMDGSYAQTVVNLDTGYVQDSRPVIETGYLHMLMKGGITYILLVLYFIFVAVYSAIKSKNTFIRYVCLILLTYLIDMYTTNPVCNFSVRSIIFWFIISICLQSRNARYHLQHNKI